MSSNRSHVQQSGRRGAAGATRPKPGARPIGTGSLMLLVGVVVIVALSSVGAFVGFVLKPNPAVRAVPMYVTLTLTTGAALLMVVAALNASFWPMMKPTQMPSLYLVMGAMGITGVVTGLLTVGQPAKAIAIRLVLGAIALVFITVRQLRLARARAAALPGHAVAPAGPASQPARSANPPASRVRHPRSRQRRGGRKH
jgi:hypothetical protein